MQLSNRIVATARKVGFDPKQIVELAKNYNRSWRTGLSGLQTPRLHRPFLSICVHAESAARWDDESKFPGSCLPAPGIDNIPIVILAISDPAFDLCAVIFAFRTWCTASAWSNKPRQGEPIL